MCWLATWIGEQKQSKTPLKGYFEKNLSRLKNGADFSSFPHFNTSQLLLDTYVFNKVIVSLTISCNEYEILLLNLIH